MITNWKESISTLVLLAGLNTPSADAQASRATGAEINPPATTAVQRSERTLHGRDAIRNALSNVAVKEPVQFDGVPLKALVADELNQIVQQSGATQRINFLIDQRAAPQLSSARIDLKPGLARVSLWDLLDAITRSSSEPLRFEIEDYGVIFAAGSPSENPKREPAPSASIYAMDPALAARYGFVVPPPTAATTVSHGQPERSLNDRLESEYIDQISFDAIPLSEVVREIIDRSKKTSPTGTPINFLLSQNVKSAHDEALGDILITVKPPLYHITLKDLLEATVRSADEPIQYEVLPFAVALSFRPESPSASSLTERLMQKRRGELGNADTLPVGKSPQILLFQVNSKDFGSNLASVLKMEEQQVDIARDLREWLSNLGLGNAGSGRQIFYNPRTSTIIIQADSRDTENIKAAMKMLGAQSDSEHHDQAALETQPRNGGVSVMGGIKKPGLFPLPSEQDLTLMDIITRAGGFTRFAKQDDIQLIRGGQTNHYTVTDILKPADSKNPQLRLQPGDAVLVPERIFKF